MLQRLPSTGEALGSFPGTSINNNSVTIRKGTQSETQREGAAGGVQRGSLLMRYLVFLVGGSLASRRLSSGPQGPGKGTAMDRKQSSIASQSLNDIVRQTENKVKDSLLGCFQRICCALPKYLLTD